MCVFVIVLFVSVTKMFSPNNCLPEFGKLDQNIAPTLSLFDTLKQSLSEVYLPNIELNHAREANQLIKTKVLTLHQKILANEMATFEEDSTAYTENLLTQIEARTQLLKEFTKPAELVVVNESNFVNNAIVAKKIVKKQTRVNKKDKAAGTSHEDNETSSETYVAKEIRKRIAQKSIPPPIDNGANIRMTRGRARQLQLEASKMAESDQIKDDIVMPQSPNQITKPKGRKRKPTSACSNSELPVSSPIVSSTSTLPTVPKPRKKTKN